MDDPTQSNMFYQEKNDEGKDTVFPRFYMRPVKNEVRSANEGRPVFEEREYVEITIPGNRGTVHDTPVREEHRRRWPNAYQAFKAGQAAPMEGTPLEEWPAMTRSQVEELRYFNIRTVEQLANLPDDGLSRAVPMGGHALRDRAQRFLEAAAGMAPMEAAAAKAEADAAKMAAMEEQIRELKAMIEKGGAAAPAA